MSSADTADTATSPIVDRLAADLGDDLIESFAKPGEDVWVRVARPAWRRAAEVAQAAGFTYFCFLSAIDWLPSPFGKDEDSQEDIAVAGTERAASTEVRTGYAGGDSRFQVFARVVSPTEHTGVILKADLEDEPVVESWTPVYAGADWHERETWEMYGVDFVGHPGLRHIYLPGEFEGFPLRKDFPLLARRVKPWPGIVDVEPMPGEEDEGEGDAAAAAATGDAPMPDAADAPTAADLTPPEPPADLPATGDPDKLAAAEAPVPAHGEVASQEQLDEAAAAAEAAGGGGVDTTGIPTGEADTGREGQGGTGQPQEREP